MSLSDDRCWLVVMFNVQAEWDWKLADVEGYVERAFNSLKPSGFVHTAMFIIQKLDVIREKLSVLVRLFGRMGYYSGYWG